MTADPAPADTAPANPYPGLRAFESDDSSCFFGRERETDELRRRLRQTRLLAVVGASGSGKSSLVRCGLVPSLHAGFMSGAGSRWRVAIFRPGQDPIGSLAAALARPGVLGEAGAAGPATTDAPAAPEATAPRLPLEVALRDSSLGLAATVRQAALPPGDNLLLVVDQFEELFRFRRRPGPQTDDEATAFVKLLLEAARAPVGSRAAGAAATPIYVVLTMRSEFIGECMAFQGLPEAINAGQYLVPGLSRDALRAAITGPAAVRGVAVAPRLLVRLLNEVGELAEANASSDQLPVLQHALMRTWDAWAADHGAGEPIDIRHYQQIGTLRDALSEHADLAWKDLAGPREQGIAERLFKALTVTNDDGLGLRRPTAFGVLRQACAAQPDELARVIDVFRAPGRAFLQPAAGVALRDDDVVDITHESLMRLWQRLVSWVQQEARATEVYRRLQRSARQHASGEAGLWRPPELTLGWRWRQETAPTAAWSGDPPEEFERAMAFLQRSRRAHLLRRTAAVLGGLALVGAAIAWLVIDARQQTELAEARGEQNRILQAEVARLGEARASAEAAQAVQMAAVQDLRATHERLKAEVTTLDARRTPLEADVARLRETNRGLDVELSRFKLEYGLLETRRDTLVATGRHLDAEVLHLRWSQLSLDDVPERLAVPAKALTSQVEALTAEQRRLQALVAETLTCAPVMSLPEEPPLSAALGAEPVKRVIAPDPDVVVPPDAEGSDALRRRIDALARELAALVEARARLLDEAAWLQQANRLLDVQRVLLQQELARLEALQRSLQQRQLALRAALVQAERRRAELLAEIAQQEQANQRQLTQIEDLRKQVSKLQQEVSSATWKLAGLDSDIRKLRTNNLRLTGQMDAAVAPLLAGAAGPGQPPDLAAMLAVKAWRWTPHDADDAAQPAVYNALWRALRALDEPAAMALLSPDRAASGAKLSTTRSALLVQALCQRADRSFSAAEWETYLPKLACYTPEVARPCVR